MSRSFVVVTDGYISVEQEVFDLIRNHADESNTFVFGIGICFVYSLGNGFGFGFGFGLGIGVACGVAFGLVDGIIFGLTYNIAFGFFIGPENALLACLGSGVGYFSVGQDIYAGEANKKALIKTLRESYMD